MGLLGKIASAGIGDLMKGIGSLAKDIRTAVKGHEMPPEAKAELDGKLIELEGKISEADTKIAEYRSSIIIAEAQGQSWLQRNWRPLLMLTIIAIVANNYVIFPYAALFTAKVKMLELPANLWALLKIGVGGYIVGRSAESITKTLRR